MAGRLGLRGPSAENLGQRGVRVRTDGDGSNNLAKDHYSEGELFDSLRCGEEDVKQTYQTRR